MSCFPNGPFSLEVKTFSNVTSSVFVRGVVSHSGASRDRLTLLTSLDDLELAPDGDEGVDGAVDVLGAVSRRQLHPDPRLT